MSSEAGNIPSDPTIGLRDPADAMIEAAMDRASATHEAVADLHQHSLKRRIVKSLAVVSSGAFLTQVLRFGSVLILSRLLMPEHYGLMAMLQVVLQGATLLSDVGIRESIVHNKKADDPKFINTAWTLQVVRGVILWCIIALLAWPISIVYDEPRLIFLIPAMGLQTIILGCNSISIFTLSRHVNPEKYTIVEIASQGLSIVAMIALALVWQSVWVLIIGSILQVTLKCIASHFLIPSFKMQFAFDRDSMKEILHFGKWIFGATFLQFLLNQGDRAILASLIVASTLGVYNMAIIITEALIVTLHKISSEVLFPTYARLADKHGRQAFRQRVGRLRGGLIAIALPGLWIMAIFGVELINLIFNDKYVEAGPVLQMTSVGAIGLVISQTANRITLARGDSKRHMIVQACRVSLMLGCMAGGVIWFGPLGLFIGQAVARIAEYPFIAWSVAKHDGWFPGMDLAAFGSSIVVIGGGWWLLDRFPPPLIEAAHTIGQTFASGG